eukprot:CAMPEP_0119135740 /NCGR_PEP_ID=MMETSP1310-20130426/19924_1 /TAXON_ID=464262 /ORGANISM="Genus nov. species nov., Strain RCC2339" /LENGTH=254 /DNA_ID=CAMNT_0007126657 /DNA_START=153 /DNA_END=914 /DNA_ORIENTATION=-
MQAGQRSDFKWVQKDAYLQITISVPPALKKGDFDVRFGRTYMYAGVHGGNVLVEGNLSHTINERKSKWKISNGVLTLHLEKVSRGRWDDVFQTKSAQSAAPGGGGGGEDKGVQCRVVWQYDAAEAGELTLLENQTITNVIKDPSGWWTGTINGVTGMFPHNFVEEIAGMGGGPPGPAGVAYSEHGHEPAPEAEPEPEPEPAPEPEATPAPAPAPSRVPVMGPGMGIQNELMTRLQSRSQIDRDRSEEKKTTAPE